MLLASLRFGARLTLDGADVLVPTSMVYTGFGGSIQLSPAVGFSGKRKNSFSLISSIVHVYIFLSGTWITDSLGHGSPG